jgi:hypothetical protein
MKLAQNEQIVYEYYFSESFLPFNTEVFADHMIITNFRLILESKSKKSMIRNELPLTSIKGVSGAYFKKFGWNWMKILFLFLSFGVLGYVGFVAFTNWTLIPLPFLLSFNESVTIDTISSGLALLLFILSFFFKNQKSMVYELNIKHEPFGVQTISKYAKDDSELTKLVMKVYPTGHELLENLGTMILDLQNGHVPPAPVSDLKKK